MAGRAARPEFVVERAGDGVRVLFGDRPVGRVVDLAERDFPGGRLIFDAEDRLLGVEVDVPEMLHDALVAGELPVRRTHDRSGEGLGYVYLAKKRTRSARTVVVVTEESDVIVDVDKRGRIVGIEFYGDGAMPPELRKG